MNLALDWKIAAVLAMLSLAAYNLMLKDFFNKGNDWRVLIPVIFAGALIAFVYFLLSFKGAGISTNAILVSLPILFLAGLMILFSFYAISNGSISIVAGVLAISTPLTALLAAYFLPNESLTQIQWVGIFLGFVSVYLVTSGG